MFLQEQNILFIARTMGLGGTENVVLQLCEILSGKAKKIIVCSSGGVHEKLLERMDIKHYCIPDIASKKPTDMVKIYLKIRKIIKEEKITVVHSHHRMAALYVELLRNNRIVKVANAHNTFYDKKWLTYYAYHNTKLIAVGNMVKKNLIEYFGLKESQISVIHNAVKPFNNEVKSIELLTRAHESGKILIGNIGRLSEQKGMSYFIDAADIVLKKHPEALFFIVGDGELKEDLVQLVRKKELEKNIIFLGYRSDIQNVMSQLDFIVLSSLWEGLPLTPIEAFSVGKTVIGTAVDGTPEIIRNGIDGCLVEARNSNQLAEKMCFLIEHSEITREMEKQASLRYKEEFSFEKLAQAYIKYYEGL